MPIVRYVTSDGFGLGELRGQREALTLGTVLQKVNAGDLSSALDMIRMRLLALQEAKENGGSWESAAKQNIIPLPVGACLQPAGLSSMTRSVAQRCLAPREMPHVGGIAAGLSD